ncbi:MAG: N-acetyl sugar amidotransferase [Rhodospirillales bacterium]|nr:N-acetyl sugar amidotransferase [Rhodospirillales bacterium]
MDRLPRRLSVDLAPFKAENGPHATRYGLPEAVRFCTRCVISNQRPNSAPEFATKADSLKTTIRFDAEGVCDACRAAEVKAKTDWSQREKELRDLCDRHRRQDGRYDCLVPGSGGKDSFYAAHILKYKYGMHPLTVTWAPHIHTDWGWRNFQNWIHAGFDNILSTPNGKVHRLLTRLALEVLFHPFQPFILGQKSIAPKMSVLYNIPLVFYGENEAEYGNPVDDNTSAKRDWTYFTAPDPAAIHLSGVSVKDLKARFGIEDNDLAPYLPADPAAMQRTGTEVHYLGYYLKWHPQSCYYYSVEHGNFEASPERTPGTYSKYNSIDDRVDDLHYYTTHVKFGIGRATYDAAQEIRSGDITRDEGVALVKRYDGEFPERFFSQLMDYVSLPAEQFPEAARMFEQPILDRAYFNHLADRFRSPHLWAYENGAWRLRKTVWDRLG